MSAGSRPAAAAALPPQLRLHRGPSHPSCRLRVSTVCRRWQSVALSPPLLARVAIHVEDRSGAGWLTRLRGATSWLVCQAAGSVQQLSLDVDNTSCSLDKEAEAEATALVAATLAALGASGTLSELDLLMGFNMPLPLGSWAAALRSLRRLAVCGRETRFLVTGDWRGLTALQSVKLENSYVGFTDCARLPPNLTSLYLSSLNGEEPMAQQVGRQRAIAGPGTGWWRGAGAPCSRGWLCCVLAASAWKQEPQGILHSSLLNLLAQTAWLALANLRMLHAPGLSTLAILPLSRRWQA